MKLPFRNIVLLAQLAAGLACAADHRPVAGGPYADRARTGNQASSNAILEMLLPSAQDSGAPAPGLAAPSGGSPGGGASQAGPALQQLELAALSGNKAWLRYPFMSAAGQAPGGAGSQGSQGINGGAASATARSYRTIPARDGEQVLLDGQVFTVKVGDESVRLYAQAGRKTGMLAWVGYLNGPDLITAPPAAGENFSPPLSAGANFSRDAGASGTTAAPVATGSPGSASR